MTGLTNDGRKAYIRETNAVGVPRDELRRHYNEIFDRLRRYEDVERRGMLVELPIKPGQMCYAISTPCGGCEHDDELPTDENLEICRRCEKRQVIEVPFDFSLFDEWGKNVFATRELAEDMLKKLAGQAGGQT